MTTAKRTTIKEIAEACGVSLSTVSLVINQNPRISDGTRDKVLAAVDKFGYEPNIHAQGLASRSSRALSVVVPHLNHVFADIYFGEIVSGIYDRASDEKYKILLDIANERFVQTREYINLLKSKRTDGLLFIASSIGDDYLHEFQGTSYPFLLVNHYFPETNLNYIAVDYRDSARQAAQHLLELGHRAIGFITGTNTNTGIDFQNTFVETCRAGGLAEKDIISVDGGERWDQEGGMNATRDILEQHPGITAIMASNDRMAMGSMSYLHQQGIRVPEDISVIGADDIPAAEFTTPSLTTIHHHLYDMGRMACEKLLGLFRGDVETCAEVLPVKLIQRDSTGPAKAGSRAKS